ncbi:FG-GAP repeat domain-containing protein [Micromonospora maritima]|uniref:FG-GAP repeat domain-containing protein n=1 Tax=Micromonospora maritima TaxID=986711 RepID=UPI0037942A36
MRMRTLGVPVLAATLTIVLTPVGATAATASFGPRLDVPAGEFAHYVAAGDLDGDGRPDMAVASGTSGTVSVRLSRDGGFRAMPDVPTPSRPMTVDIADVTGDGRPDLVTADLGGTVSVHPGRGDGRFRAARSIDLGGSSNPWGVDAADLDGDRDLDLVVGLTGLPEIHVFRNDGRGRFTAGQIVEFGYGDFNAVRVADLNSDGRADLVATETLASRLAVLLGTGPATFGEPQRINLINDTSPAVLGDYDSDGVLDIVASRRESFADSGWLLHGNGDGTFAEPVTIPVRWSETATGGDFDGDGRADVAFATASVVFVLLGNGDGTFQEALELPVDGQVGVPAAADFNGDGKDDLAVPNGYGLPSTVWVFPTT